MGVGFDRVYREYGGPVYGYLSRLTGDPWLAEELCQETFVRFLKHRDRLEGRNGTLGAWLFTVATNLARDRYRRRSPESLQHDPETGDDTAVVDARDLDARVRREVELLPPALREVFLLRAHHEMTYARVAQVVSISERTAKERFRLAREILAHRLGPLLHED